MDKKLNKKISIFALCIMLLSFSACQDSKKEYVDGNILHLALSDQTKYEDRTPSPFDYNTFISNLLYRKLFIAENDFYNLKLDLAESYSVSADSLTYTIKMKEGQKWSDGEPITLDDFFFTIDTLINNTQPYQPLILHALSEIEDISRNGYEMQIKLAKPHYNFMPMLAQMPLLPKHKLEHLPYDLRDNDINFWQNPVTSSMYKVNSITPNEVIELVRNEEFGGQSAKIEQVNFYFNHTPAHLDMYHSNNIADITQYRSMRHKYDEFPVEVLFYRYFLFNMQGDDGFVNPKLQDKSIREALCYAVDNVGLVESIYFQSAEIAKQQTQDSADFLVYNPEKAKELIAQSDYDLSIPIRLAYYYTDDTSLSIMHYIKRNLEAVGFKVELVFTKTHNDIYVTREYDILYKGLPPFSRLDWYNEYSPTNTSLSKLIYTQGAFNDLLDNLAQSSDSQTANELLDDLHKKEREFLYKFIIYQPMHACYINRERVLLPKNVKFINPWYNSSVNFENWEIKKK